MREHHAVFFFLLLLLLVLMVVGGLFPIWRWPARLGPQPSRWRLCRLTDGAYPLRVNPLFLLLSKRKSGSGLRKRKGWAGGNFGEVRYNRIEGRFCRVVPRVKDFGMSFCFRRPAFERPVVPFAPLPLSGWNTVTCSLVFTPPVGGGCCPALPPYRWGVSLTGKALFLLWESGVFLLCGCFFACPAGAKTAFSFALQKKKRFWTPKKKR